jgi:hypothetical protein
MTLDVKGIFAAGKIKCENQRCTGNDRSLSLLRVFRMVQLSHLKCVKEKVNKSDV